MNVRKVIMVLKDTFDYNRLKGLDKEDICERINILADLIDLRSLFLRRDAKFIPAPYYCIKCMGDDLSFSVNKKIFYCPKCDFAGDWIAAYMHGKDMSLVEAYNAAIKEIRETLLTEFIKK